MFYIQRKGDGYLETVDEFETRKEARDALAEYQSSDRSTEYYISTRACREWQQAHQKAQLVHAQARVFRSLFGAGRPF